MRGIGEVARASGLSVSALRFYDGAGVLVPAAVDPVTGYRRYADAQIRTARLVAGLRRVGMPLADITAAVQDPSSVRGLLSRHLRRLEDGLADARREFSRIHALLDLEESPMTRATLPAAVLAASLDAVRFAASTDASLPMLGGVLLETKPAALTLVTTDRYRLAVSRTAADVEGPPIRLLIPLVLADELRALLADTAPDSPVTVTLDPTSPRSRTGGAPQIAEIASNGQPQVQDREEVGREEDGRGEDGRAQARRGWVGVVVAGREVGGEAMDADFPDYERLIHERFPGHEEWTPAERTRAVETHAQQTHAQRADNSVTVDVARLRAAVAAAPAVWREHGGTSYPISILRLDAASGVRLAAEAEWTADTDAHVAVNREFLLEALDAGGAGQLELELDGPIKPLAVRVPGEAHRFSILMPVRH